MKIKLVFQDWQKDGHSIYSTPEGIDLSLGDFHSGTTFDADIDVYGGDKELEQSIKNGYTPVFYAISGD